MTYREIGDCAARARGIPLETVLHAMGAAQDRHDKAKWRTARGVISVNGARFMDWGCARGGGGAIDLVMHVGGIGFKDAVAWLWERFPGSGALVELPQPPPRRVEFRLPRLCPALHARVVSYLEHERALPRTLIDELAAAGAVYADARGNAVFVLLGKKRARSARSSGGRRRCNGAAWRLGRGRTTATSPCPPPAVPPRPWCCASRRSTP